MFQLQEYTMEKFLLLIVFVTNEGTYAVSSDWMYTKWHTHELKQRRIRVHLNLEPIERNIT